MKRRFQVPFIVSLFLATTINLSPSSAQVKSNTGKSWKSGVASSADFVQITITNVQSQQISGTISLRFKGLWQGAKVKNFSGTQQPILNFMRLDCTCEDGMKFAGWYWPGNTGSRTDDRAAMYFRPMATPSEIVNDCHPDDSQFIVIESDTEPVL